MGATSRPRAESGAFLCRQRVSPDRGLSGLGANDGMSGDSVLSPQNNGLFCVSLPIRLWKAGIATGRGGERRPARRPDWFRGFSKSLRGRTCGRLDGSGGWWFWPRTGHRPLSYLRRIRGELA